MRLETVGPAGPDHNFTIVDLFACLTITGLAIAIFRNLPRISIAQQDISLGLILATLVACFVLYRGASETRYSFAAWCIMLIGFVIGLPTLDVLFEVSTDSPWSWSWASSQYVRNRSLTYLSVFTAVWLTTKWLVRSGFVLKTNRRTSQGWAAGSCSTLASSDDEHRRVSTPSQNRSRHGQRASRKPALEYHLR